MTFAQRRNRLTTHFSERIPVVKRRISVQSSCSNSMMHCMLLMQPSPSDISSPFSTPSLKRETDRERERERDQNLIFISLTATAVLFLKASLENLPKYREVLRNLEMNKFFIVAANLVMTFAICLLLLLLLLLLLSLLLLLFLFFVAAAVVLLFFVASAVVVLLLLLLLLFCCCFVVFVVVVAAAAAAVVVVVLTK